MEEPLPMSRVLVAKHHERGVARSAKVRYRKCPWSDAMCRLDWSRQGKEMNMITQSIAEASRFEVWFESLYNSGRGLVFPCDETGHVDLDALSDRGRSNYLLARAMLGREYATPRVVTRAASSMH
jgi:hypothetical protein